MNSATESASAPGRRAGGLAWHLRAGVWVLLAAAAAGPAVGALWAWLAPKERVVVGEAGFYAAEPEGQAAIAADGWFAVLGLLAGLGFGAVVFFATRGRGAIAAVALAVGGSGASVLAWLTGRWFAPGDMGSAARDSAIGARIDLPLQLGAKGVLLAWPIVSLAVLLVLTATLERVDPPGAWRAPDPYGT